MCGLSGLFRAKGGKNPKARGYRGPDVIFIMDPEQRRWLESTFTTHPALSRVICLDIPDVFTFLQPELVELLEQRVPQHLPTI